MNYTRKRALLACDFCRHRKRRCDGERPCSTCRESNADCRYKDLPIERVESPSASSEAVVERLGRIEALLEEQGQQLQHLFIHGPSSSSFEGSHVSISPKVSIDATAAGAESSEAADAHLYATSSHHFSRSSFHLAPEFAAAAVAGLGSITAAGTPGSSTTSPPAPIPIPVGVSPLLSIDASHRNTPHQYLYQHPQHHQPQPQHPQTFFHQHAPIPYHGVNAGSNTAAPTPVFGFSTGTTPAFPSGSGLTTSGSRALLTGKASSVATSDVSSHNIEQDQQFLIPLEHSTAANTLLSLPLVRFFLEYQQRSKISAPERRSSGGNSGKSSFSSFLYPRTYFFDIETHHPLPPQLDLIYSPGLVPAILPPHVLAASHPTVLDGLVRNYFAYVHPSAPLFSAAQFRQWSSKVYEQGPDDSIGTAICLIVWALGSLATPSPPGRNNVAPSRSSSSSSPSPDPSAQRHQQAERDRFALSLFQPAMKIILHHTLWEFGPASLDICQALLLAASYFSHVGRPLHNARMVHLASRKLIRLLEEHRRDGSEPEKDGRLLSVFWVCFIWECDGAAELDVPRSGIEPLADNMPLPSSLDPDDGDDMICFVAEIAARRLFNRIHSSLYATGSSDSAQGNLVIPDSDSATSGRTTPGYKRKRGENDMYATTLGASTTGAGAGAGLGLSGSDNTGIGKMLPVSAELNRQLETWYRAMPDHIRPPLGNNTGSNRADGNVTSGMSFVDDLNNLSGDDAPWQDSRQKHTTKPLNERVQILRIHYYAARHIIHRPFVLGVAWQQQQQILAREHGSGGTNTGAGVRVSDEANNPQPPASASASASPLPTAVLEKCAICVDSCAAYLVHVLPLLERRSPYLWSFCQSSMACLLVLLVADACPSIAASQPIAGQQCAQTIDIARLRDQVASRLRRWATPGSSFEAELRIVEGLPIAPNRDGDL